MGVVTENFPDISFIEDTTIDDVRTQMISDYQDKYEEITGKACTLAKADPYRQIMYACSLQIYQAMQYVDHAGKMNFLKYASGDFLENLGALRGVSRIDSTAATTTLKFSMDTAIQSAVAIPAGTRATNGNDVFFATDEYAEIAAGDTEVSVSATCTETGTGGNGFEEGEINIIVNTLPYITAVTNTSETSGGSGTEEDDDLKDRIYGISSTYSVAGSISAYEYWAKQADSSISDVVVYSDTAGVVTIVIVCDGGELPSDDLLEKVADYLEDEDIKLDTDEVIVRAPDTVSYDVECTYYIAESDKNSVSAIQENVESAVDAYNIWQTESIGRDINPSDLIYRIYLAGAKRVEVASPTFTSVASSAIAVTGTVTVNYGGLEDD